MYDCSGFLKCTVIYYYLNNKNFNDYDNCIDIYHANLFILIITPLYFQPT